MKRMLIVGGTGIVGRPLAYKAIDAGYDLSVIAMEGQERLPHSTNYYELDRRNEEAFRNGLVSITGQNDWNVVVDVNPYSKKDAQILSDSIGKKIEHVFILSTTLVYDRKKVSFKPLSEDHPLAEKGKQGKYVDDKIELEEFWRETGVNWTILRPYHILGANSLLGCLPPHNRDPEIPELIRAGIPITLPEGGRIPINVVHPQDLGEIIVRGANNPLTFRKVYNSVNPTEILARDYFATVAAQLGVPLKVRAETAESFWKNPNGWSLTTLPHLYDVERLKSDVGYVPNTPLDDCIKDALKHRPVLDQTKLAHSLPTGSQIPDIPVHQNMNKRPFPERHKDYAEE